MESSERSESYYAVLGVAGDSSVDEIRRAYRRLAMKWHPDKWVGRNSSLLGEAKIRFQKIQEAYAVLSDPKKRALYDAGLYDPDDEEDEGFCDFMHEMCSLMSQVRQEEKPCSIEDLQNMFSELVQSFEPPQWFPATQPAFYNPGFSNGHFPEAHQFMGSSQMPTSFQMFSWSSYSS
ncbi:Chaperone protein DnaJ 1-like protein [Drosera capensis]